MRGAILFVTGLFAGVAIHSLAAQDARIPGAHLNHVMIRVPDLEQAKKFYMDTFGFTETFHIKPEDGSLPYVYLQVSQNTFIELMKATPEIPPGITHFGLEVANSGETVKRLRQRGLTVNDPMVTRTKALITHVRNPTPGVDIEIGEYRADSFLRKAMTGWK